MTTNDAFERNLSIWLHEDAEHHVPDHLAEVLQRTAATHQRPAWSSLERWLPMDTTFRRSVFTRQTPVRQLALLFLIALLIAALVAFAVGSRRSNLAPYGLARNGDVVVSRDGDIFLIDASTSAESLLLGDPGFDFSPVFSRDGSMFTFLRSDGPVAEPAMLSLMVADADGSNVRALTPPMPSLDWFDWSPSGTQIAYVSRVDGEGVITVANVNRPGSVRLPTGQPAMFVTWLPPDGTEILYRGEHLKDSDPPPGLFAIRPDGKSLPRRIPTRPANNQYDYQGITVAPDGSRVSFARFTSDGTPSVVILDLRTSEETVLPHAPGTSQRGGATFSPDGIHVAYSRIYGDGSYQLVVAPADGSNVGTVLGPRQSGGTEGTSYAFTPDGSAVISMFGSDDRRAIWRFPIDGSPGSIVTEGGSFSFTDVQRLAP
jgi:Tol biopolymer transport system component